MFQGLASWVNRFPGESSILSLPSYQFDKVRRFGTIAAVVSVR